MPGYLPEKQLSAELVEKDVAPATLANLPLADLLNVISQAKMPVSNNCYGKQQGGQPRPGCRGVRNSQCSTREPSEGSRPNSARPSSGGSRPNSARPSSGGSRPNSARPNSARRSDSVRDQGGQIVFMKAMPAGRSFTPRGFLEPKVVGNGSQWDQERLLQPERAYPCIERGAGEYHDRNVERENRPAWKPTKANRVSGMGVQVDAAFPMPPRPMSARRGRPLSARPRSAAQA